MGLRINQNIAAMNAYRNLSVTDGQMSKSLEKLSSGFRINRAADDAAGLSISEGLRAQVGGLKVAVRNAQDGISVVQTAEGALNEVHSILQRMRDLAVQASSTGAQDTTARQAADEEVAQLSAELDRIGNTTRFGNTKLLDGNYGATPSRLAGVVTNSTALADLGDGDTTGVIVGANNQFGLVANGNAVVQVQVAAASYYDANSYQTALQTGIDAHAGLAGVTATVKDIGDNMWKVSFQDADGQTLTVSNGTANNGLTALTGLAAAATDTGGAGTGGTFQIGANSGETIDVAIEAVSTSALTLGGLDLDSAPSSAISLIDDAIAVVSEQRADLGALQNRFEHTINNLNVAVENLSASESRIRDVDMAQEMMSFTRTQILTQAGTAMLAQANQAPQSVLSLLR